MPLDQEGKPVPETKKGSLHFHCNLGSCYDSMIQENVNSYVPKHKSWLKPADLAFVAKLTKEEIDAEATHQKNKSGFDIMFEQVSKE